MARTHFIPLYRRVLRAGGGRKFRIRFYGMEVSQFNLKYATGSHLSQITIPLNPANVCGRAWRKYLVLDGGSRVEV